MHFGTKVLQMTTSRHNLTSLPLTVKWRLKWQKKRIHPGSSLGFEKAQLSREDQSRL